MYLFPCIICISISLACSAFQVFFKGWAIYFLCQCLYPPSNLLSFIELVAIHICGDGASETLPQHLEGAEMRQRERTYVKCIELRH